MERTPGAPPPGALTEHTRKSEHHDPETSAAYSLKRIADTLEEILKLLKSI